jgi:hypothetical protein
MSNILRLLSEKTGLHEYLIKQIISSAPTRYKSYEIPKRTGGLRQIAQPAREVKLLQRAFIETSLARLPIHAAATAYREGLSILDNAKPHLGAGPILKMDFKDFFPSIKKKDWVHYCNKFEIFADEQDIDLTSLLLFYEPKGLKGLRLAIGAPSSPMLSNVLMFEFDTIITKLVTDDQVVYTRYADDLTFSAPRTGYLKDVIHNVKKTLRNLRHPKLQINEEKTTYITRKYHRSITGITLSNDGRATIGRPLKRQIFAAVYHAKEGKLNEEEMMKLCGYLAFINAVEPNFIGVLKRKYGDELIVQIQHKVKVGSSALSRLQ